MPPTVLIAAFQQTGKTTAVTKNHNQMTPERSRLAGRGGEGRERPGSQQFRKPREICPPLRPLSLRRRKRSKDGELQFPACNWAVASEALQLPACSETSRSHLLLLPRFPLPLFPAGSVCACARRPEQSYPNVRWWPVRLWNPRKAESPPLSHKGRTWRSHPALSRRGLPRQPLSSHLRGRASPWAREEEKARCGRRVGVCGAGLRGSRRLAGYESSEASRGLCRPHRPPTPQHIPHPLPLLHPPPPPRLPPPPSLPLASVQQRPPGKGSEAAAAAAAAAAGGGGGWGELEPPSKASSTGEPV
ncbi:LOW QUALITY PROTEIN: uncharacterized protein C6orf132-like [Sarcophilus harrisii]|uniref:LOW QUALITY PROTEIN: uncharacterized protein C6orf132-like n=1 Tax=Sarcophilus harrisii TaxID=9305 RepID=UPI001301B804|nr:LOW QUALITY PROTEIN: uncharacterized protein C6orf132-like [Sarcophilus harrisii]